MEESLQKMTVQRADKAFFFTKDNCIDKTYELEKGIKMFPSIFIEDTTMIICFTSLLCKGNMKTTQWE